MTLYIIPPIHGNHDSTLWSPHPTYTVRPFGAMGAIVRSPTTTGFGVVKNTGLVLAVDPESPPDWPRLLTFADGALRIVDTAGGLAKVVDTGPATSPALRASWAREGRYVVWQTERAKDLAGLTAGEDPAASSGQFRLRLWDRYTDASWALGETSSTVFTLSPAGEWLVTGGLNSVVLQATAVGRRAGPAVRLPRQPTAVAVGDDGTVFAGLIDGSVAVVQEGAIVELAAPPPPGRCRLLAGGRAGGRASLHADARRVGWRRAAPDQRPPAPRCRRG